MNPSNSVSDEGCAIYLAEGLTHGESELEDTEADLMVRKVPLTEAVAMVMRGEIADSMSMIGLLKVARIRGLYLSATIPSSQDHRSSPPSRMTIKTHLRENFHLAYPVMLSNLGHVLMGVSDSVMVGHVGATPLAAAGLANVIFNVLLLFGVGVSYAITPLVGVAHGERNDARIIEVFRHGLLINLLNGLLLVGVVYSARNVLYFIDQPPEFRVKPQSKPDIGCCG